MEPFVLMILVVMVLMACASAPWAMALLIMMLILEVSLQASSSTFRAMPMLGNVLAALPASLSIARVLAREPRPLMGYLTKESIATFVLLGWSVFSLAWSPTNSVPGGRTMSASGLYLITESIPYFLVFVVAAPLLMTSVASWRQTCSVLLWVGPIIAATILFNPELAIRGGRLGTTLEGAARSSPLALSQAGGVIAIVGALAVTPQGARIGALLRWAAFVGGTAVTLLSGTRGQAVFAAVCIVIAFPISRPLLNPKSFVSVVVSGALMVLVAIFVFDFALTQTDNDRWKANAVVSGTNVRLYNALELLTAFADTPSAWFIGLGFNAFSAICGDPREGYSHNLYVDILCELGVPMFLLFAGSLMGCLHQARRLIKIHADSPVDRAAVATLIALATYSLLIAGKEGNLWASFSVYMYLAIIARLGVREGVAVPVSETS